MTKLPRCRPAPPRSRSVASSSDGRLAAARRWNPSTDAFELPFHGRANLASERNFQLVTALRGKVAADAPIVLLHGKLDEATYSLDFRYPLSPLHAFALALVTWGW